MYTGVYGCRERVWWGPDPTPLRDCATSTRSSLPLTSPDDRSGDTVGPRGGVGGTAQ